MNVRLQPMHRSHAQTRDDVTTQNHGADEALVNNDYVASLKYSSLWQDSVHLIENAGHAPFWDDPTSFNRLLESYLTSLESTNV